MSLHAIGSFGERLDHQTFIFISPSLHLRVRVNDRRDIVNDIFLLPSLVVEVYLA